MMKAGGGSEVGYNVQAAVDTKHHLIVAHEVTNTPTDRGQLASMASQAKDATQSRQMTVIADRGYYNGDEILACQQQKTRAPAPKTDSSSSKAAGRFGKSDFLYDGKRDAYICPAKQRLTYRFDTLDHGKIRRVYMTYACSRCALQTKCTTGNAKRLKRWEHEQVLDRAEAQLRKMPNAMTLRKQSVEHPFGSIKSWMGATHFVMKRLPNVQTEMSLYVLAYNLKWMIKLLGAPRLIQTIQAA
jgi:hypothetical protein